MEQPRAFSVAQMEQPRAFSETAPLQRQTASTVGRVPIEWSVYLKGHLVSKDGGMQLCFQSDPEKTSKQWSSTHGVCCLQRIHLLSVAQPAILS
jgi:hypothetical protein